MKTPSQVTLFFEAEGADAHDAVRALTGLVASDFLGADGDEQPSGEQPAAAQPT
jgi:hypothetical protein